MREEEEEAFITEIAEEFAAAARAYTTICLR